MTRKVSSHCSDSRQLNHLHLHLPKETTSRGPVGRSVTALTARCPNSRQAKKIQSINLILMAAMPLTHSIARAITPTQSVQACRCLAAMPTGPQRCLLKCSSRRSRNCAGTAPRTKRSFCLRSQSPRASFKHGMLCGLNCKPWSRNTFWRCVPNHAHNFDLTRLLY